VTAALALGGAALCGCACGGQDAAQAAPDAGIAGLAQSRAPVPGASRLIGEPAPVRPALTLELIDAGGEPRRRLRYAAVAGRRQRVHFKSTLTTAVAFGGKRQSRERGPDTEAWLEIEVVAASPERLDCQVHFVRGESMVREGTEAFADLHRRSLEWLRGPLVRFSADRRGVTEVSPFELRPELGHDTDVDLAWVIASTAVRAVIALPDEPVGPGAHWRIDEEEHRTVSGRRTTDVELRAVRGRRVELALSRGFVVPPQLVGVQRTYLVGVSTMKAVSHGRALVDLDRLHPLEWQVETEATLDGEGQILGERLSTSDVWSISESGSGR